MPDTGKRVPYFYTDVPDKLGEGARLLNTLRDTTGVNLLTYSNSPKGRREQLDFIPADMAAFRTAARKGRLALVGLKTGFLIQGEDRPGAVAEIIAELAEPSSICDGLRCGGGRGGALWDDFVGQAAGGAQKAARVLGAVKEERRQGSRGQRQCQSSHP